ncbi:MAG: ABC transporter ATP-binding protein [Acetobacteraceae bacterium]
MVPLQGRELTGLLRITGLSVRYGATRALAELDMTVRRGELFVLLGGSGSGKSTLLRAIAGFVRPESGRIQLDGADLAPLPPWRRPVNTMFQSYALFPHMTVAANVAFGLAGRGLSRARIAGRVAEMLALVRLQGMEPRRPHQLSGGQQQRVALARSLAPNPALLLLDEPLSALDRGLRLETRTELMRVNRALGMAFILVTHDQQEALSMADRIGLMQDGRLVQVGTPAEMYERPASRFVARFLGSANILEGTVQPDGRTFVLADGTVLRAALLGIPGPGYLAVRPERLRLGGEPAPNRLSGVVVEQAYGGEAMEWTVRLGDRTEMRVTQALRDGRGAVHAEPGTPTTLSWHPDASILLST